MRKPKPSSTHKIFFPLIGAVAGMIMLCSQDARAREPFSVPFKPLKHDVLAAEILWQGENIVDMQQTLRIARDPSQYQEVGQLGWITGNHPTVHQVWWVSGLFAIGHYAITQALTDTGCITCVRVWSYTSLGAKTVNMQRNERAGLGY